MCGAAQLTLFCVGSKGTNSVGELEECISLHVIVPSTSLSALVVIGVSVGTGIELGTVSHADMDDLLSKRVVVNLVTDFSGQTEQSGAQRVSLVTDILSVEGLAILPHCFIHRSL